MTGTGNSEWGWRDTSGSSPRLQRIAANTAFTAKQTAYRAYMEHAMGCDDCEYGEVRCEKATELHRRWRETPS
jgi:hypothetical protein